MRAGAGRRPWAARDPSSAPGPRSVAAAGARSRSRTCRRARPARARPARPAATPMPTSAKWRSSRLARCSADCIQARTIARGVASDAGAPREVLAHRPRRDVAQVARRPDAREHRRAAGGGVVEEAPAHHLARVARGHAAQQRLGLQAPERRARARSAFIRHSVAARRSSAAAWPGSASARSQRSLAARARAAGPRSACAVAGAARATNASTATTLWRERASMDPRTPLGRAAPCRLSPARRSSTPVRCGPSPAPPYFPSVGAWRSLVARSVWGRKVAGSNPAAPTLRDPAGPRGPRSSAG